ncbi:phosphatidylinositol 4-phosphate 5-kinase-like protein 1 [Parambassis ranga]|uniref:Phosphatidylinositol 4-phosphate 5-kinase-like protein 1 n=1 Tax=Parambassis ranga TaxID=210632 RepID=A0A6P7IU70_9TELE|nr:phosphatidylinositol 4-phosphate 5-kinase-like protein 1 [Parambassis ranga]
MAPKKSTRTSGATSQRTWLHLRQQWGMMGMFEITPEHEFYHLTSMMKDGIHASIQATMDTPVQDTLSPEHFKEEETEAHEGFVMQTFAAPVFAKLRRSLDIKEEEYMNCLCSDGCYLQFVSNSKSKANFFVTNNKRFFLKTQSRREVRFLLSNLHAYMDHLEKYPHSLLVRFLGVHRIISNQIKKYFIVMQSVFYPDERINIRYDIKGCEVGRWTDPDTGEKHRIKVLKDNNFRGQCISLGQDKSWFASQVKLDAAFLRELNVLDYSLLLAHQPLHKEEIERKHTLANLVIRTTKTDLELQEFHKQHRRLLPDFKNAVHVIDGPDRRYFVGIIDIFTMYGWKKRLESLSKSLRYPGRSFSTVSPTKYSHRFCQWIQGHTQ